ncbi:MAG: biotin/lipoyl-containing protein, partial [Leifsonia sp.]
MITVFNLPDLGEGLTESEVVAWHVAPGDTVALNQHIADVETAKAVVELPSPFAGTVTQLHQQPGVVIQVGDPLVSFEVKDAGGADAGGSDAEAGGPDAEAGGSDAGADSAADADAGEARTVSAEAVPEVRTAVLVGYGAEVEGATRPLRTPRRQTLVGQPEQTSPPSPAPTERPRSTP